MIPETVELVSGPGCPVCVTPEEYIDRLIELGENGSTIMTFGDMIKVPGTKESLGDFKARGGRVQMVYSPFQALESAKANKEENFVFAAVGFETIVPVYAMLAERMVSENVENMRMLCSLKTISPALRKLAPKVDAFIAPGHVAAIVGEVEFENLAKELNRPFCIAGFTTAAVKLAVTKLREQVENKDNCATNLYSSVVSYNGNEKALTLMEKVFAPGNATWRGIGEIEDSGLYLKDEYEIFDAGSRIPIKEKKKSPCRCGQVLCGEILPRECPLFGKSCNPMTPKGPCMVSSEGACGIWYQCGGSL